MRALDTVRGTLALLLALAAFPPMALPLRLVVMPAAWLRPAWRWGLAAWFMKAMSAWILKSLELGGARFTRVGRLPTSDPVLVVANHQSLVDICVLTLMADPYIPGFVARTRYARFVPLVSPCIRLAGCPAIDPKKDPRGAARIMAEAARTHPHGLLVFPEGHRTTDGSVRPFRTSGLLAILGARRLPVYLAVTDGLWAARRFVDFLANVPRLRGRTEVLGPFAPPEDDAELPAFIESLRARMVAHLEQMRSRTDAAA